MVKKLKKEIWDNLSEETQVILVLLFSYIFKEEAEYDDGDPDFFVWENAEWEFSDENDIILSYCALNVGIEGYDDGTFYLEIYCSIKKNIVNCYGKEILDNITDFKSFGFGGIPEKEGSLNIIKLIFAAQLEKAMGIDIGAKHLLKQSLIPKGEKIFNFFNSCDFLPILAFQYFEEDETIASIFSFSYET